MTKPILRDLPYELIDGLPVHKATGKPYVNEKLDGKTHKRSYIKQLLQLKQPTPEKFKVTIIQHGKKFYLRSKANEIHATRYATKEQAAEAARKLAAGLIKWSPTITQVQNANLTNAT